MFLATSTHVTNVTLYKNLNYDFKRDFVPVSQVAFIPNLLVVNASLPVNNLAEFLAYVRDPKNRVSYGSARSEEHTSELQSLMRTSYAVFCLNKKQTIQYY